MIPIWGFLAATLPLVLTPGASTALVLKNSLTAGTRAGLETAVGVNASSLVYGLLCAFGFAIVLQRWPNLWLMLRLAGSGYLAWLGVQSVRSAFARRGAPAPRLRVARPPSAAPLKHLREGFVINAANPAIATLYFLILPQFIPKDASVARAALVLTAVHVGVAITWHSVWAAAGGTLSHVLAGGRPRQMLDLTAGLTLIVLAVRLLLR